MTRQHISAFAAISICLAWLARPLLAADAASDLVFSTAFPWRPVVSSEEGDRFPRQQFEAWLAASRRAGVTGIRLAVPWSAIEPETNRQEFGWLDARLKIAKAYYDEQVVIIIDYRDAPAWILSRSDSCMRDSDGRVATIPGELFASEKSDICQSISFYSPYVRERMLFFAASLAKHIAADEGLRVLAYVPVWTAAMESEYPPYQWVGFDAAAQVQFRVWLKRKYGALSKLESKWDRKVGDWSNVKLPEVCRRCGTTKFNKVEFLDFVQFREDVLASLYAQLRAAVHAEDRHAKFGLQWGASAFTANAPLRGTLNIARLSAGVDWIFAGAQPGFPHALLDRILVSNTHTSTALCRELDGPKILRKNLKGSRDEVASARRNGLCITLANWDGLGSVQAMADDQFHFLFASAGADVDWVSNNWCRADEVQLLLSDLYLAWRSYGKKVEQLTSQFAADEASCQRRYRIVDDIN